MTNVFTALPHIFPCPETLKTVHLTCWEILSIMIQVKWKIHELILSEIHLLYVEQILGKAELN